MPRARSCKSGANGPDARDQLGHSQRRYLLDPPEVQVAQENACTLMPDAGEDRDGERGEEMALRAAEDVVDAPLRQDIGRYAGKPACLPPTPPSHPDPDARRSLFSSRAATSRGGPKSLREPVRSRKIRRPPTRRAGCNAKPAPSEHGTLSPPARGRGGSRGGKGRFSWRGKGESRRRHPRRPPRPKRTARGRAPNCPGPRRPGVSAGGRRPPVPGQWGRKG